jgi:hypothetical protein
MEKAKTIFSIILLLIVFIFIVLIILGFTTGDSPSFLTGQSMINTNSDSENQCQTGKRSIFGECCKSGQVSNLGLCCDPNVCAYIKPLNTDPSTEAPTSSPTEAPTNSSTNSPIDSSTNSPIDSSTNSPIDSSTNLPIDSSTNSPIDSSTNSPIDFSTNSPIDSSTNSPTEAPIQTPKEFCQDLVINNECYESLESCLNNEIDLKICSENLGSDHFCCSSYSELPDPDKDMSNFCYSLLQEYPAIIEDGVTKGCKINYGDSSNSCLQKDPQRSQRIEMCSHNKTGLFDAFSVNFCCSEDIIPIVQCDYYGASGCSNTGPPINAPINAPIFPQEQCNDFISLNGCQYSDSVNKPETSIYDFEHDWINVEGCTITEEPEKNFFWCPMVGPNSEPGYDNRYYFCPFQTENNGPEQNKCDFCNTLAQGGTGYGSCKWASMFSDPKDPCVNNKCDYGVNNSCSHGSSPGCNTLSESLECPSGYKELTECTSDLNDKFCCKDDMEFPIMAGYTHTPHIDITQAPAIVVTYPPVGSVEIGDCPPGECYECISDMCQWWDGSLYNCVMPDGIYLTSTSINFGILSDPMISILAPYMNFAEGQPVGEEQLKDPYNLYGGLLPGKFPASKEGPTVNDPILFLTDKIETPEGQLALENFISQFRTGGESNEGANSIVIMKMVDMYDVNNLPPPSSSVPGVVYDFYDFYWVQFADKSSYVDPETGLVNYKPCENFMINCSDVKIWTISEKDGVKFSPPKFEFNCSVSE